MADPQPQPYANVYQNSLTGASVNPVMPAPDGVDEAFASAANQALALAVETLATGYGIHGWLLRHNRPVRLSPAELEAHPEWRGFFTKAVAHPPMRGWLAAPIVDRAGTNWGLLQLSDKYEGEFTAEDEHNVAKFAELLSMTLEALWAVRNLEKQSAGATPAASTAEAPAE